MAPRSIILTSWSCLGVFLSRTKGRDYRHTSQQRPEFSKNCDLLCAVNVAPLIICVLRRRDLTSQKRSPKQAGRARCKSLTLVSLAHPFSEL